MRSSLALLYLRHVHVVMSIEGRDILALKTIVKVSQEMSMHSRGSLDRLTDAIRARTDAQSVSGQEATRHNVIDPQWRLVRPQ